MCIQNVVNPHLKLSSWVGVETISARASPARVVNAITMTRSVKPWPLTYTIPWYAPIIIASPTIITKPLEDTVRQGANAIFSCKAEGHPLPTISWQHNGRAVADGHRDFLVSTNSDGSGRAHVTSELRILSANVDKTGYLTCVTSASSPTDSGISLISQTASTSVTVLGMWTRSGT